MKFAFVARYRPVWPTRMMCRLLCVSASGFYESFGRSPSTRSLANASLLVRIGKLRFESADVWFTAGLERLGRGGVKGGPRIALRD